MLSYDTILFHGSVIAVDGEGYLQQTHKSGNPANALKTMELIDRLMEAVPIYRLSCNMERSAAKVAFEGMQRYKLAEQRG